jgi:hypothetical protein
MPSNKGYIWSGVWFFGHLPEEKGAPIIMFERKNNDFMIHEYHPTEYRLYKKINDGPKQIIQSTPRKNLGSITVL